LYLLAGLTVATTRVSLRAEAAPAGAGAGDAVPREAAPADPRRPTGRDRAARPALQPRPTNGPGRFF
jgi:hypothetical protein